MLKNHNNNYKFNIDKFYKNYLKGPRIFKNRDALESSYVPDKLPHRDTQIKDIIEKTACALLGDTPQNFLCYGMIGTGKTVTIRYVSQKLAQENSKIKPSWIYINCNIFSTPYRILAHIYNTISRQDKIPPTGLLKDIIFKNLIRLLDSKFGNSIFFLVLDEINVLADKKGFNEILCDLIKLNENLDNCKTSLIVISNKLKFWENLDPRIISNLGEEHILFPLYSTDQLKDILIERSKISFLKGVLTKEVIPLCTVLATMKYGYAQKALELLRRAGELAERAQNKIITVKHVRKAQKELENDYIKEYIKNLPLQAQIILLSIYLISKFNPEHTIISGDIYNIHSKVAELIPGVRQLTRRRIADYINDLSLVGIISAEVKSMGHYGRTKIIKFDIRMKLIEKALVKIDRIQGILNYKPIFL